jgi:hypothetical protein
VKKSTERPGRGAAKPAIRAATPVPATKAPAAIDEAVLIGDLRTLVQAARQRIATVAYSTQTLLCWHVGRRLSNEHLQGGRAAYGRQVFVTVSRELTDEAIVVTLSQQLSWSHFHALLPIKDPLARDFYAEMCRIERWDVRTLRKKLGGMLYQRTALSKKLEAVISAEICKLRDGRMSPDTVFHIPICSTCWGSIAVGRCRRCHRRTP